METRARYVLVGLFTILGILAALGFTLWVAQAELDRTYRQYDILLDSVAGLNEASAVRYNGVDVGRVLTIALDRTDPSLVRVRIEIYAGTPIREDTIATLASQGVTGVAFIALAGGSAQSPPLLPIEPADVAVIQSEKSVVQDLMLGAPDLLAESIALIGEVRTFVTPENREAIASILDNIAEATGRVDALTDRALVTLDRVDALLVVAEQGFALANGLMEQEIPALITQFDQVAASTGGAVAGVQEFAEQDLPDLSAQVSALIAEARGAMSGLQSFAQSDLPGLSAQVRTVISNTSGVIADFRALAGQIGSDPGRFLLGNQTPEYRRN